jgi:hypothetical protein
LTSPITGSSAKREHEYRAARNALPEQSRHGNSDVGNQLALTYRTTRQRADDHSYIAPQRTVRMESPAANPQKVNQMNIKLGVLLIALGVAAAYFALPPLLLTMFDPLLSALRN